MLILPDFGHCYTHFLTELLLPRLYTPKGFSKTKVYLTIHDTIMNNAVKITMSFVTA